MAKQLPKYASIILKAAKEIYKKHGLTINPECCQNNGMLLYCPTTTARIILSASGYHQYGFDQRIVVDIFDGVRPLAKELNLTEVECRFTNSEKGGSGNLVFRLPQDALLWKATYKIGYEGKRLGLNKEKVEELRTLAYEFLMKNNVEI